MIVVLNGTYGVGKTAIANEIQKMIQDEKVVVFDPDEFFDNLGQDFWLEFIMEGGGTTPQNNKLFLNRLKEQLNMYMDADIICIIPMALTTKETKEIIGEFLRNRSNLLLHFILEADDKTIIERINADESRDQKDLALYELRSNVTFLRNNFEDAIRVDTENKGKEEIADEIINTINEVRYGYLSKGESDAQPDSYKTEYPIP